MPPILLYSLVVGFGGELSLGSLIDFFSGGGSLAVWSVSFPPPFDPLDEPLCECRLQTYTQTQ